MSEEEDTVIRPPSSKKRKSFGRMTDVGKKLRLSSHETGLDCHCQKLKCFESVTPEIRKEIISNFNKIAAYDEQSVYLCGLITCKKVARHRPRKVEDEADFHSYSYKYKVRAIKNNDLCEIPVCYKAFLSLHGITAKRVQTLQEGLKSTGKAPIDKRGKHENRPNRVPTHVTDSIIEHIKSFKTRSSHYSLVKSNRRYLPEELNVKKMYNMYKSKFPDHKVSYEKYREVFISKFNISFGFPRSDTCSFCDELLVQMNALNDKIKKTESSSDTYKQLNEELKSFQTKKELHLRKAKTFYDRKRAARYEAQQNPQKEAIAMDFEKNLPVPNIQTNDVYYRRQLAFYMFNIHVLSTSEAIFYTYPEVCGKKGSDDVASVLCDFIFNHLDPRVDELTIFCDSCGGQNKNFTIFRFLHYIVHFTKRLKSIKVVFPVRGHSYLECDKNMGLINQKTRVELPNEWNSVVENSRSKPSPFKVISCEDQTVFKAWTKFLSDIYVKKCPFKSRPVRELSVVDYHPRMVLHRSSFNGPQTESVVIKAKRKRKRRSLEEGCFEMPTILYTEKIPVSKPKFQDLQVLKKFCSEEAQHYFDTLPHSN